VYWDWPWAQLQQWLSIGISQGHSLGNGSATAMEMGTALVSGICRLYLAKVWICVLRLISGQCGQYGLLLIMGYILWLMCGLVFHWAWPMWLIELIYANNSFYVLWGPTHGLHVLFSFVLCLANMAQGISPMLTLVQWWILYINQWYVYTIGT